MPYIIVSLTYIFVSYRIILLPFGTKPYLLPTISFIKNTS